MTNYSAPHYLPPRSLVDWVGFSNFADMFRLPMWNDTFWGVNLKTGEGRNELGKALMKVRAELAARQV